MQRLKKLNSVLEEIDKTSRKILKRALPIMKELEDIDSYLVDDYLDKTGGDNREEALERLQNISLQLISDSEIVQKEIVNFSESVIQGEEGLENQSDQFPFLLEVWCGDMYGESDIDGLRLLSNDLKRQLLDVTDERLIEMAMAD